MSSGRIAFFSDVHGCQGALSAVLASIAAKGITRLIFLGDAVGYGPEPSDCVRVLRERSDICLLGNHDAMATDERFDLSALSDQVAVPLELARRELAPEEKRWLAGLPLTWSGDGVSASHGSQHNPPLFIHVDTAERARLHFSRQVVPISFFGHTHVPVVYGMDAGGRLRMAPGLEGEIRLEGQERYAVGVGSVGFSRDGDPRAAWVEFRPDIPSVVFHRVEFDAAGVGLRTARLLAGERPLASP